MIRYMLLLIALLLSACATTTDHCDSLHYVNKGVYLGEGYTVRLPSKHCTITRYRGERFRAVNFDLIARSKIDQKLFSIELSFIEQPQSNAEFQEYWESFLPRYLTGNFGEFGRYKTVFYEKGPAQYGVDTFVFAGTGHHNETSRPVGSIIGLSKNYGKRVVTFYVLINETLSEGSKEIYTTENFTSFVEFYQSFVPKW